MKPLKPTSDRLVSNTWHRPRIVRIAQPVPGRRVVFGLDVRVEQSELCAGGQLLLLDGIKQRPGVAVSPEFRWSVNCSDRVARPRRSGGLQHDRVGPQRRRHGPIDTPDPPCGPGVLHRLQPPRYVLLNRPLVTPALVYVSERDGTLGVIGDVAVESRIDGLSGHAVDCAGGCGRYVERPPY